MALLATTNTQAYVNHGRWTADCTRPYCGNAVELTRGQTTFHCINCLLITGVDWPSNPDEIWAALLLRPVPQTRNWSPAGHRQALVDGFPNGQTVADLRDENDEYGVA